MSKISELSDGGSLVSSDYLIAVRSGGNVKVRMDSINVDQVDLGDNEFIRLGNSQDLTMVHTSTQSIINQAGIGDLLIQKAGATKLTINATGIDVTGSVTADGLTVDTDTLVVDATNNRVGIGTSSVEGRLHVYNGASGKSYAVDGADQLILENNSSVLMDIRTPADATGGILFSDANARGRGVIQYSHSADAMYFNTAGASAMTIDSSGNLGIGVSPSYALDVSNQGSSGVVARFTGGGAASYIYADTTTVYYGAAAGVPNCLGINNASNFLNFNTNGAERIRIDASGNLLVGKTATSFSLAGIGLMGNDQILATAASDNPLALNRLTTDGDIARFYMDSAQVGSIACRSSGGNLQIHTNQSGIDFSGDGYLPMRGSTITDNSLDIGSSGFRYKDLHLSGTATAAGIIASDNTVQSIGIGINDGAGYINSKSAAGGVMPLAFYTGGTEKARIDASGNLLVGCTAEASASVAGLSVNPQGYLNSSRGTTATAGHHQFFNPNGICGVITTTGTTTTYSTSSDQRLKENIADADGAGSKIDSIQVRKFDWKADGSHQDYGMVAQELLEVAPEAVSQGETEEEMMGVDYSKLVPMMLKEIQSLRARVAQLES